MTPDKLRFFDKSGEKPLSEIGPGNHRLVIPDPDEKKGDVMLGERFHRSSRFLSHAILANMAENGWNEEGGIAGEVYISPATDEGKIEGLVGEMIAADRWEGGSEEEEEYRNFLGTAEVRVNPNRGSFSLDVGMTVEKANKAVKILSALMPGFVVSVDE